MVKMSGSSDRWKPFTSRQRVVTGRPGFLWDAQVSMAPGLSAHVVDCYIAGEGLLYAAVLGLFTVAHESTCCSERVAMKHQAAMPALTDIWTVERGAAHTYDGTTHGDLKPHS
jgi:hypothetical protein